MGGAGGGAAAISANDFLGPCAAACSEEGAALADAGFGGGGAAAISAKDFLGGCAGAAGLGSSFFSSLAGAGTGAGTGAFFSSLAGAGAGVGAFFSCGAALGGAGAGAGAALGTGVGAALASSFLGASLGLSSFFSLRRAKAASRSLDPASWAGAGADVAAASLGASAGFAAAAAAGAGAAAAGPCATAVFSEDVFAFAVSDLKSKTFPSLSCCIVLYCVRFEKEYIGENHDWNMGSNNASELYYPTKTASSARLGHSQIEDKYILVF